MRAKWFRLIRQPPVMMVLVSLVFVTLSCGISSPSPETAPTPIEVTEPIDDPTPTSTPRNLTMVSAESAAAALAEVPATGGEPVALYLEETIPPCTPIAGSEADPCITGDPTVMVSESAHTYLPDEFPTLSEIMLWGPEFLPHIVVRATALPDTSRCGLYQITPPNTVSAEHHESLDQRAYYYCFVDVRINEYIVGEGPPTLTVAIYRESLLAEGIETFGANALADEYFDGPARTAAAYEGKELIIFLGISFTLDVETWVAGYNSEETWFVQRNGDEIRAVSGLIAWARTPEHRRRLNMPLSQLVQEVKQAAQNRIAVTDGRTRQKPDLAASGDRRQ